MNYRLFIGILLIIIGSATLGWYSLEDGIVHSIQEGTQQVQDLADRPGNVAQLAKEVFTPPPLRGPQSSNSVTLTESGVLTETNAQRLANSSAAALTRNATLDSAAENKLADLFARQYFDHVSPTGKGPADGVEEVGYMYLKVGENLALGNFASDAALVQAWMDSPGHRANILASGFQEIGIAVGQGAFEGESTWIAVQTFGTPESACPAPDESIKSLINKNQESIALTEEELSVLKEDIDAIVEKKITSQEEQQEAQKELDALRDVYNSKVTEVNTSIAETKDLITQYNNQAKTFNACITALE